jgi:hypothetical protein
MLEYTTCVPMGAGYNGITPINQGWSCPKCGSAHAPHVQTCPQSFGTIVPTWGGAAPCAPYTVTCGPTSTLAGPALGTLYNAKP